MKISWPCSGSSATFPSSSLNKVEQTGKKKHTSKNVNLFHEIDRKKFPRTKPSTLTTSSSSCKKDLHTFLTHTHTLTYTHTISPTIPTPHHPSALETISTGNPSKSRWIILHAYLIMLKARPRHDVFAVSGWSPLPSPLLTHTHTWTIKQDNHFRALPSTAFEKKMKLEAGKGDMTKGSGRRKWSTFDACGILKVVFWLRVEIRFGSASQKKKESGCWNFSCSKFSRNGNARWDVCVVCVSFRGAQNYVNEICFCYAEKGCWHGISNLF